MSHRASCRSLIREKPVVAIRSCSPIHTARLFFAPAWPAVSTTGFSCRASHILSFLSRDVVTRRDPLALHDIDWMTSPTLRESLEDPASMSQILIVKSPDADASTFSAAGLNRTWPTFLHSLLASSFDVRALGLTWGGLKAFRQAPHLRSRLASHLDAV